MPITLIWISFMVINPSTQSVFITLSNTKTLVTKTNSFNVSEAQRFKQIEFGITPVIKKRSVLRR